MNILLIGCGNMGSAMLMAWLGRNMITRAVVVDHAVQELRRRFGAEAYAIDLYLNIEDLPPDLNVDLVVLAVKPQNMTEALMDLAPRLKPDWHVLTIAAGLRCSYYSRYLPGNTIIRAMPNTPVMIGKGMTVAVAQKALVPAMRSKIDNLLKATGDFFWIDDEDLMDSIIAMNATGAGLFFYFAEQMAKAGIQHGLTAEQAMRLVRQTLIGTGAMAEAQPDVSIAQMRENVTSKGGTTAAALQAWDVDAAFENLVAEGVAACVKRSKELSDA